MARRLDDKLLAEGDKEELIVQSYRSEGFELRVFTSCPPTRFQRLDLIVSRLDARAELALILLEGHSHW